MEIGSSTQSDISSVLSQMRALRERAQAGQDVAAAQLSKSAISSLDRGVSVNLSGSTPQTNQSEFGNMLQDALRGVNHLQKVASQSQTDYVRSKEDDLVKVMINSQKSSIGFQALVQVRNRMVSAYQDILKMPI